MSDRTGVYSYIDEVVENFVENSKGVRFARISIQALDPKLISHPPSVGKGLGDIVVKDGAVISEHTVVTRDGVVVREGDVYNFINKEIAESGNVYLRILKDFGVRVETTP